LTGTSEPAAAAAADRWTDGMRDGGAHGPLAGTDDGLLPGPFARQESLYMDDCEWDLGAAVQGTPKTSTCSRRRLKTSRCRDQGRTRRVENQSPTCGRLDT
jgi:hypothetical protein